MRYDPFRVLLMFFRFFRYQLTGSFFGFPCRRKILHLCLSIRPQLTVIHYYVSAPDIDAPKFLGLKVLKYKYSFHSMSV